jgi:hypothetical protein
MPMRNERGNPMRKLATLTLFIALAFEGGCNRKPATAFAANEAAVNESTNAIAEDKTVDPADQAFAAAAADATADEGANAVARKSGQSLSLYVGHYPWEPIGGTSFRDDPAVTKAVMAAVPVRKIRDFVLSSSGPESLITVKDGRLLATGCESHNCGFHDWSIAIEPNGSNAEVCYLETENPETGRAKFYVHDRQMVEKHGDCPG